jgi:hypothetical protein
MDKKDLRLADANQIWRTLGISDKVRETTAGGAKDTDKTFNCSQDDHCEAQIKLSSLAARGCSRL